MGVKANPMSKEKFLKFFGAFQQLLIDGRKPEDGYYLTGVEIVDLPSDEILLGFDIEYGPIANYNSEGGINAEMLECRMCYVFGKDGTFKRYEGVEPGYNMDYHPSHCSLPAFEDFPDPEDKDTDLFGAIRCVISKCMGCGKMLNSIQFRTLSPEYDYDYSPGIPVTRYSPGEPAYFEGWAKGICLKDNMLDEYTYCYTLQQSRIAEGEYDLVFWVK